MMRRVVCIIMVVLFLATIVTGIAELHVHSDSSAHHVFIAVLFFISVCVHSWLNRKALIKHFSRASRD